MMKFTKDNTLQEILENKAISPYFKTIFGEFLLELYPKDMRHLAVGAVEQLILFTPWEEPFSVITGQLLDAANQAVALGITGERECIPLWLQGKKECSQWSFPGEKSIGKDSTYLIAPVVFSQIEAIKRKPVAIIVPGGGYEAVCYANEGTPIQNKLEEAGYVTFTLNYRVSPNRYPAPQLDLALAIRYVRYHANHYGIDPNQLLVVGFSAGGHLTASIGALYQEIEQELSHEVRRSGVDPLMYSDDISILPNGLCLGYPVISFMKEHHESSFDCLTGKEEKLRQPLSLEYRIHHDFPKTYVWACEDDDLVPASNAIRLAKAMEEAKVEHRLAIFKTGGHGCGLAYTKEGKNWSNEMLAFFPW